MNIVPVCFCRLIHLSALFITSRVAADAVIIVFERYDALTSRCLQYPFLNTSSSSVRFRKRLSQYWFQTMNEIQALDDGSNDAMIQRWIALGTRLNISSGQKPDPTDRRWGRSCHWHNCLCVLGASHPLRVCKGCWESYYCSTFCQTL